MDVPENSQVMPPNHSRSYNLINMSKNMLDKI